MRRSTAVTVLMVLTWLGFAMPASAATAQQVDRVVVIGVPGLRWDDVSEARTPALARMQRDGASGLLSVKTAAPRDCAAAGWLTLGAGNRVDPAGDEPARCSTALPDASSLPAEVAANAERREGAVPGLLARALRRGGSCVDALGPGAELGAADLSGAVGVSGAAEPCPVLLRSADLTTVDAIVGAELDRRKPGHVVLVVGLSELGSQTPHLHVALALGPGFARGELVSASTRRPGYVQLVDVAPTLLALQGLTAPPEMIGEPWRSSGARPTLAVLRDGDRQAGAQRGVTVPFFVVLCGVQLVLLLPALWRRWWRTAQAVALSGVTALGASYVANLVPWWRAGSPLLAVLVLTTAGALVLTGLAMLGRGVLSRAGLACGMVAAVVTVDLLTGASLQLSSVAGYSPLVAGRFAGIGNVAFGVLAAAVLLAAAATRRAAVAALTALVVVVDGAPQWGSDVGGVLALVPAYAVLVLLLSGRAASLGRVAVAAVTGE